jgi:epoxyqueuosine reductase
LGWIGKNTLLIHPKGSTYFIGEVFTDLDLDPDVSYRKHDCGSCNKCVKACPTHALDIPYVLNANKCLSYQSIERKQVEWNASLKKEGTNYIYGCDICQRVCPYNTINYKTKTPEFAMKPEILSFSNTQWENLSEEDFNHIFADSAAKRIGYLKFKENVCVANKNLFSEENVESRK